MIIKYIYRQSIRSIFIIFLGIIIPINLLYAQHSDIDYFIEINSDKSFYVVGETIGLSIIIPEFLNNETIKNDFVYCDLISQEGNIKSTLKTKLINGEGKGQFLIPNSLKSGYYIVRAYTRKMRINPLSYAFIELRIINIDDESILSAGANQSIKLSIDSVNIDKNEIVVNGLSQKYSPNSEVNFSIKLDTVNCIPSSVSVSVIPKLAFAVNKLKTEQIGSIEIDSTVIFDEDRGFTLIAKISNTDSSNTYNRKRIFVSVMGAKTTQTVISDSNGYFYVSMPNIYNEHEVYISTDTIDNNAKVFIIRDNDIYSNYLLDKELRLTVEEKELALLLSQSVAINTSFFMESDIETSKNDKETVPFYYEPDQTTVIMDYIDLPSLSMYFTEVPNGARLFKEKKKTKVRIYGENEVPLFLNPLIMIDFVAVNDIEPILNISPKSINRIEVVKQYYQLGDASFGGIINFITNNNDFGGFNFANSALMINYNFLNFYKDFDNGYLIKESNTPDTRTTLYWCPNSDINEGEMQIKFRTSNVSTTYTLVVRGIEKSGKAFYFTEDFEVK